MVDGVKTMIDRREARAVSVDLLLGSGYLWLARDLDGSIAAYSHKPFKSYAECWCIEEGETKSMWRCVDDGDLYNFVKWEDDEPVNIREWLEKEEEEMKMYSVKDGELECREVDADFFEKNTTLGGILTPKELDRDNNIISDDTTVVNMNSRNSGKSAILDIAKKFREGLEAGIDYGYEPPVSIVADQFEYSHEPLDVASMYPGDTISENATTLGGLLATMGVDMASYDDLTVEPLIRFPYLTSNMMATDTKDYDETDLLIEEKPHPERLRQLVSDGIYTRQLTLDKPNNVQIHGKICQELTETYEKKNADYGNSFENSLDKHGLIAGIIRMDDKMSRLISLNSKKEQLVLDESLRDTLMDLANYAIMSVMWLDEQ